MTIVMDIQRKVGVAADGTVGPATIAAIAAALGVTKTPRRLADPAKFFADVRGALFAGALSVRQSEGIDHKLAAIGAAGFSIAQAAYAMATSYWETAQTMQPIEEIGKGRGRAYGGAGRHGGQIAYGRGDVQLTWDYNYARADDELGLAGALTRNYALALDPAISARIMVGGMAGGWFTGKRLDSYLPDPMGSPAQFVQARRIINGVDRAEKIAGFAMTFQRAFVAGGWA